MSENPSETPETPETPAEQPQAGSEQESKTFDAEYVANLRKEAAKYRTEAKSRETELAEAQAAQQAQLDAIAKALGLKGDEPPDPAKLTEQLTQEQARAREAAVQLAVYRNASTNGANPDALLDSASFLRSLADVDPADSDAVAAAIKAALETNPLLKAAGDQFPSPGQAGIGVTGGGGQPLNPRAADLAQIEADLAAAKRR